MKMTVSAYIGGFPCTLEFEAVQIQEALHQVHELLAHGIYPPTDERIRPLRPLQPGQYRALVTQIKRDDGVVRLWFRGCKYESAKIFEISDLAVVGIDYRNLQDGVETPVRFFAIYVLSEKHNKNDNPYKDVVWLESADGYDVRTDPLGNVLEVRSALGHDVTSEGASMLVESSHDEMARDDVVSDPASEEPSPLDEYFPRDDHEPEKPITPPATGPTDFYKRLGELKSGKLVAFDVERKPPVSEEMGAAKQSGDWAQALTALEAQARV